MTKISAFLSSTIYDFQDLRSAVKYWLAKKGIQVIASEYPDAKVEVSENSYQACLNAIEHAEYYILLIGYRNGGWFNREQHISITRAEYRYALELFRKQGRPKIISMIRKEVSMLHHDRKILAKKIKGKVDVSIEHNLLYNSTRQADGIEHVFALLMK